MSGWCSCLLWTVMGSPATSSEPGKCPTAWMHGSRGLVCAGGLTHVCPVAEAVTKAPAPVLHALRYRCPWCGEGDHSFRLSSGLNSCFLPGTVSRWQQRQQQKQLCSSGSSFSSPSSLCSVRASRCISSHCCNISPMSNRPPPCPQPTHCGLVKCATPHSAAQSPGSRPGPAVADCTRQSHFVCPPGAGRPSTLPPPTGPTTCWSIPGCMRPFGPTRCQPAP